MDNGIDIVLEDEELEVEVQEDFLKGDKGDPGYTPVRGIDYYTEQDKQELIDELTEDIQGVKNDFNTNVATKTNEFNANVVSKTTEFNNNATNKMAEFNTNTITKINEYNENAEDLINRVIEAEAENERLRQDLNGLPTGQAEGETIDITDSTEMRFSEFNVRGNSRQETRSGKNKFNIDGSIYNGTLQKYNNGFILSKATNRTLGYNVSIQKGSYTLSYEIVNSNLVSNLKLTIIGSSTTQTINLSGGENVFIATEEIKQLYFFIPDTEEDTATITLDDIQIEPGEKKTPYEQYGASPSPDYPSEVESNGDNVNLFDIEASTEFIDCTKNDDEILTQIGKANPVIVNSGLIFKTGKYLMSFLAKKNNGSYSSGFSSIQFLTGNSIALTKLQNPIISEEYQKYIFSFDLETETTFGRILLQLNSNPQSVISIKNIKIEKGSKATPYSPYGQGCINEVVCNKNLFNKDKAVQNYYYNSNGVLSLSYNWFYQNVKVKPNTVYYISGNNKDNNAAYFVEFDKNMNFIKTIGYYSSVSKFTTSDKTEYVGLSIPYYEGADNDINTLQLEEDTISTTYIEHQSQTFTIPTQQPLRSVGDVRDTFIKKNNKWFERHYIKRKIFDGTTNRFAYKHTTIYTDTNGFYQLELPNKILGATGNVGYGLCNYLEYVNKTASEAVKVKCLWWENSKKFNYASIPFLTLEEANAWLVELNDNGNPLYIDYVLATPNDIECTEEQSEILWDIEQNAKTYKNITHMYSTDNVSPNVEVTYKKDIETLFANTLVEGV